MENLEKRVVRLESALTLLAKSILGESTLGTVSSVEQGESDQVSTSTPPPFEPTGSVSASTEPTSALDAEGYPWDARINTSNQTTTQKGTYKRKRGIEDDFYNTVRAEIYVGTASNAAPANTIVNVPGTPRTIEGVVTESDVAPVVPTVPETPVVPTVPETPTIPAVPGAPAIKEDPELELRNEFNEAVNRLNAYHGVTRELITAQVMTPYGGDTVNSLTDLQGATTEAKAWVKQCDEIEKYLNAFDDLVESNPELTDNIKQGLAAIAFNAGAKEYIAMTIEQGLGYVKALFDWYGQWAKAYNLPVLK